MKRALAALLVAGAAHAQYDPAYRWRTISTERFDVHFHQGAYPVALKIARMAEEAHRRLAPMMGRAPRERTQIVLSDDLDDANGAATARPRNTMWLYVAAPDPQSTLQHYDDHLWLLVTHEYTHVLHLDNVGGVPALVNRVFGKVIAPNEREPGWVTEGIAVYQESATTSAGRIDSSLHEMMVRAQALEGGLPPLDRLSNLPLDWPRGNSRYVFGGRFLASVAERAGDEGVARFARDYGSRLIPYFLNSAAEVATGESFHAHYARWREETTARAEALAARVRAEGETAVRALTARGEETGRPRWAPAGDRIFYSTRDGNGWPELRAVGLDRSDALVAEINAPAPIALSPDGASVLVAQPEVSRQFRFYDDLWWIDARGRAERLTRDARLTEPDVARDGRIVAVQRRDGARTALVLVPGGTLYAPAAAVRVGTPRWSPDGAQVAFVEHGARSHDVRVLEVATGAVRTVAGSDAEEIDPAFGPDGALWFASDAGGRFEIWRAQEQTMCRTTNVVNGLFSPQPSPDGTKLAVVTYSARGFDIGVVETAGLQCRDRMPEPEAGTGGRNRMPGPEPETGRRNRRPEPEPVAYAVGPYKPSETLPPRVWLPILPNPLDWRYSDIGAFTFGSDVVGLHAWSAVGWYNLGSRQPGFNLSYAARLAWPTFGASISSDARQAPGARTTYLERGTSFDASATLPWSTVRRAQSLRLGYSLAFLAPVDRRADPAYIPDAGRIARLDLTYSYGSTRRYALSISREEGTGFTIGAGAGSTLLGGQFDIQQLSASLRHYLRIPGTRHHVLALRAQGGAARGSLGRRQIFSLGGQQHLGNLLSALRGTLPDAALRGYPPGAFGGSAMYLATAEYRFPILDVDRGLWTLPLGLRRVHGALFADAGDAFEWHQRPRARIGAGGELRLEFVWSYDFPIQARIGYAQGFSRGGERQFYYGLGATF